MSTNLVKAAAVQISPVLYSREGTVEKVVEKIISLGKQGVQFAIYNTQLLFDADGTLDSASPQDNADVRRAHDLGAG